MSRFVCLLMLGGLLAASGCEPKSADRTPVDRTPGPGKVTSDDVRRDARKAVDTATDYSQQAKEEFQKKLEARLKDLDAEIAELREKGSDLSDEAKADWDRKMAALEAKREAAHAKLAEVGESSAEAWKDVQQGAQSAWDELEKAFQDAAREF